MTDGSARELVVVAFAVPVITMAVLVVAVLSVLLFAGSGLEGLATAVGTIWLAIHQVPVTISGVSVGVLPLLPTLLVAVGTGRMAASASGPERSGSELVPVLCSALGGPLLMTALSLAVVMDGMTVQPVQSPPALLAFAYTLGIHAAAAGAGIAWRRRDDLYERFAITAAVRRGGRAGGVAVTALLTCATVLVIARLLLRWTLVGDLIAGGNDFDGYLGLTVLSILYLPNVVVATAAVLVGSDAHVGGTTVDLTAVHAGPVPPLPVLGALPETAAGLPGIVGFLVPLVIALAVALRCRSVDPLANVRSVTVAAAVAASVMVILCAMAGGELGEFGDAGVTLPTAGVFTLGWIAVVGLVVALIHAALPSTRAARQTVGVLVDDDLDDDGYGYDDDYLTDEYESDEYESEYGEDDDWEYDYSDGEYSDDLSDDDAPSADAYSDEDPGGRTGQGGVRYVDRDHEDLQYDESTMTADDDALDTSAVSFAGDVADPTGPRVERDDVDRPLGRH
jgi:hypothetical protein